MKEMTETRGLEIRDRCAAHMNKRHTITQKEGNHATYSQAKYIIYHSCPHTSYDNKMNSDTDRMLKDDQDNIQVSESTHQVR